MIPSPGITRRALLAATASVVLEARCGGSARRVLDAHRFGARGDGLADDAPALQRALSVARPGDILRCRPHAVYALGAPLDIRSDDITLDIAGGTLRGSALLAIEQCRGVRVTRGRLLSSTGGSTAGVQQIELREAAGCRIDHLRAEGGGGLVVGVNAGRDHVIEDNVIRQGAIGGFSCSGVVLRRNRLEDSPQNAMGFTGYRGGPCIGTRYEYNQIYGYGRIGIEEHSPDGAEFNRGAVLRGNRIGAPASGASTAISAIGTSMRVEGNAIEDAPGYGVEVTGEASRVVRNHVIYSDPRPGAIGIVVNSGRADKPGSVVLGNRIAGAGIGILLFAEPTLGRVAVTGNSVMDSLEVGIQLSPPNGAPARVLCNGNRMRFRDAATGHRVGLSTVAGGVVVDNVISYSPGAASVEDVALLFVGADVHLEDNRVDGGGGAATSTAPPGTAWPGWTLAGNRFSGGAHLDLTRLVRPDQH